MTPAVPHHIKETALKPIDFQDRVARLASHCAELGLDAYVEAGGTVMRDLFQDDARGWRACTGSTAPSCPGGGPWS